jgi:hypothetical protein
MRILAYIGLVIVVTACGATDVNDRLTLRLAADRSSLTASDTVRLTLTLINQSSEAATVLAPSCPHFFTVTDALGRTAGPPRTACFAIMLPPVILAPGESLLVSDAWAADSGKAHDRNTLRVAPGNYQIVASLIGEGRKVSSAPVTMAVQ